jgi:hypothetical protein
MKTNFLLPNYWKKIGIALFLIAVTLLTIRLNNYSFRIDAPVFGHWYQYSLNDSHDILKHYYNLGWETKDITETLIILFGILGLSFFYFAKDKIEDELSAKIRFNSLAIAVLINAGLCFATIHLSKEYYVFMALCIINLFSNLIVAILRYYYLKFRFHKIGEEVLHKNSHLLLPHYFKYLAWLLIGIAFIANLEHLSNAEFKILIPERLDWLSNTFTQHFERNTVSYYVISSPENTTYKPLLFMCSILGPVLLVFCKEKIEDEYISALRLKALTISIMVHLAFILIANLTVWGMHFLNVMVYAMFTPALFYVFYFNYLKYKMKKALEADEFVKLKINISRKRLLPNYWRARGYILLLVGVAIYYFTSTEAPTNANIPLYGAYTVYFTDGFTSVSHSYFNWDMNDVHIASFLICLIPGIMVFLFTSEKIEDELSGKMRLNAMAWALIINSGIILIANLAFWGGDFIKVLEFNLASILLIAIARYRYLKYIFLRKGDIKLMNVFRFSTKWKYLGYLLLAAAGATHIYKLEHRYEYLLLAPKNFDLAWNNTMKLFNISTTTFTSNYYDYYDIGATLLIVAVIAGALLIILSKEKIEDELVRELRMNSLSFSIIAHYSIMIVLTIFPIGLSIFDIMAYGMFAPLLLYICRFNYLKYMLKRSLSNDHNIEGICI